MKLLVVIGRLLAGLWKWLWERPLRAAFVVVLGHAVFHLLVTDPGLRGEIADAREDTAKAEGERDDEAAAHQHTKAVYAAAQLEAARLDRERAARVQALQQEINDEVAADYNRRLAAARADAQRLRDRAAAGAAAERAAPAELLPGLQASAAGPDAAPEGDRLPSPARFSDEIDWRLIATEQAIQLDALITFVERQAEIDPNLEAGAPTEAGE